MGIWIISVPGFYNSLFGMLDSLSAVECTSQLVYIHLALQVKKVDKDKLLEIIGTQRNLMISVAPGGSTINSVYKEYT
jgi:hypothetical protein